MDRILRKQDTAQAPAPGARAGLASDLVRGPVQHRRLIWRLARRDLEARYRGSLLGTVWFLVQPLIMLGVFAFVFSVVFPSRWGVAGNEQSFVLLLYAGLVVYGLLSEPLVRAPGLLAENTSYIKKVVFPLEVLPWVSVAVAAANACASGLLLLAFHLVLRGVPPVTSLLAPVIVMPLIVVAVGLSFILASLGLFIRDLRQIMPVASQVLLFLGPIFYPVENLPAPIRPWIFLNPVTLIVEDVRLVVFEGRLPDLVPLLVYTLVALVVLVSGFALFRRLRPAFSDVV